MAEKDYPAGTCSSDDTGPEPRLKCIALTPDISKLWHAKLADPLTEKVPIFVCECVCVCVYVCECTRMCIQVTIIVFHHWLPLFEPKCYLVQHI